MTLRLDLGDPIPKSVRTVVAKQLDKALRSLQGNKVGLSDAAIHNARKRFKQIRAVLRLVREDLGDKVFRRENRSFRNAGRTLSEVRDVKVLIDTLNDLAGRYRKRLKPQSIAQLRRALAARRRHVRHRVIRQDRAVVKILQEVRKARKRLKDWPLHDRGWKSIEGGLERVYVQGRHTMAHAHADRREESFHEWRKRTKDLRYELELLQSLWPSVMKAMAGQAKALAEIQGNEHDLAVLRTVAQQVLGKSQSIENKRLYGLIEERREALHHQSAELGEKLFEEKPREFVRRIRGYWQTAHRSSS